MSRIVISAPTITPRQRLLIRHPARVLWIGTGTKTGKTIALGTWITEGLLAGELCAWVGPWFQRTRAAFEGIKAMLAPMIDSSEIRATEGMLRIRSTSGGGLDCYSGDNPEALFGGNYSRVVLDEASRMPEKAFTAALTITSATRGKVRCAFNVELGAKNWAIRNLLRVQAMTAEQREKMSEEVMCFPTGGEGLVDPALIEMMRAQMPEPLWRALYLAEIPESDTSLFRNLDQIFNGQALAGPVDGRTYAMGVDLGRKQDFTVATVIDSRSHAIVASDRFHEISWSLQVQRCAALYKRFRCSKAMVDATGIGDPVIEELQKAGLYIKPYIFTAPSRKALLENLILACDKLEISLPASDRFGFYKHEMQSFEYQLDGSSIKYAAPPNMHDDCVMSLALSLEAATHGAFELTLVNYRLQQLQQAQVKCFQTQQAPDRCDTCGSTAVVIRGQLLRCNQCGSETRWYPPPPAEAPRNPERRHL